MDDDPAQGKDRPVLLIRRKSSMLLGLQLSSQDHDRDAADEAHYWLDIRSGSWDSSITSTELQQGAPGVGWHYAPRMAADTYTVHRSLRMDAPPERVYEQIADFHNWPHWSPWEDIDPELQRTYSGADSGTGAVYRWSGNRKAGQGRMEITDTTEASTVQIDLAFEKP